MVHGVIYVLRNKITGKCYVGQTTVGLEKRWKEHLKSTSHCPVISKALKKYGATNFERDAVAQAHSQEELDTLEVSWIIRIGSLSPNGYNLQSDARGGWRSEESLTRLRASAKKARQRMADLGLPKGPSRLTEKDVRAIFRMYEAGKPQDTLATHFQVDPSTISHILRGSTWSHLGLISKRGFGRRLSVSEVREILHAFYDEGTPVSQLVQNYKVQKGTINKILRGATHPEIYNQVAKDRPRTRLLLNLRDNIMAARDLYKWSYPQLGREFGVSTGYAWKLCNYSHTISSDK